VRIGFDGGSLANRRGFGRFARSLLAALGRLAPPHEIVVFLDRPSAETVSVPSAFETVLVEVGEAPSRAASASGRRRLADILGFSRAAARARLEVMSFPASYSFFPVWNVGRTVVTVFDVLPALYPELVFPNRRGRIFWNLKEHVAITSSDLVLTTSNASRSGLMARYRLGPERLALMSAGIDPLFRPTEDGPDSRAALTRHGVEVDAHFLLYVGGLSPHKNLSRLIEAFAAAAPPEALLVIAGDPGDVFHTHRPELRALVERLGLSERVRFTGFVPDEDLVFLYGRADALIQPSLMEGFGLTPVEAMGCGAPVLYSRAGSLPEVVGPAGLAFEPTDTNAIAAAIRTIFEAPMERKRLAAEALTRSAQFTWERAARQWLAHVEDLADRPRSRRIA